MSTPSTSLDDLLFDALTLKPFQRVTSAASRRPATQTSGEARPFLTPTAQIREISPGDVQALTPLEARQRLDDLMAQPEFREQVMLELGQVVPNDTIFQGLGPLLGATNAEEFTQALITWTGTNQPETLEKHLQTLTQNMDDALTHLRSSGPPPALTSNVTPDLTAVASEVQVAPFLSPLLLSFLSLSQVAQTEEVQQDAAFTPAPPAVTLPAVQLNFSKGNLERVLERKFPPGS